MISFVFQQPRPTGREAIRVLSVEQQISALMEINEGPPCVLERKVQRTVILMDATGSMHAVLKRAMDCVHTMFQRSIESLKAAEPPIEGGFELMFTVYRNYDAPAEMLLQSSSWEATADGLRDFMKQVNGHENCLNYGWGHEAMEVGLDHVLRAHQALRVKEPDNDKPIAQVVVIGDMLG